MSTADRRADDEGVSAADAVAEIQAEQLADLVSLQEHLNVFQAALEAIAALPAGESHRAPAIAANALAGGGWRRREG